MKEKIIYGVCVASNINKFEIRVGKRRAYVLRRMVEVPGKKRRARKKTRSCIVL